MTNTDRPWPTMQPAGASAAGAPGRVPTSQQPSYPFSGQQQSASPSRAISANRPGQRQLTPNSYRRMTPVERKEARLQDILQTHAEQTRRLAFERQQIMAAQGLYLGKVEPLQPEEPDAQTRAANRQMLVQQLQEELAGAEAMVESLRMGNSFAVARKAALNVHAELSELRGQGQSSPAGQFTGSPAGASFAAHTSHMAQPGAGQPMSHAATSQAVSHATSARSTAAASRHPAAQGMPFLTDAHTLAHASAPAGRTHARPGAHKGLSLLWQEPLSHSTTSGGDHATGKSESEYHMGDMHEASEPGWASTAHKDHFHAPVGRSAQATRSRQAVDSAISSPPSRSGGGLSRPEGDAPAYISELKQQVETLRSLMETQLKQQQQPQAPIIMTMPWQQQPQQQQQAQQPSGLPDGLPPEVAALDPSMRMLHARHMRELTLLRWEIDRARTAAELEQLRTTLAQMQQASQPPGRASGQHILEASKALPDPAPMPPALGSPGPQDVVMMDVPPHQAHTQQQQLLDSESDEEDDFTDEDDMLGDHPTSQAPGTVVRADLLHVHVMSVGPCNVRGSYRLRVVLYDGFQPLYVGPGLVVGASTTRRSLTSNNGAQVVLFNETLSLRGLSLSATMMLVFELYLAKQAIAGMPSREDLAAWAYCNALTQGQVLSGRQSVPMYRLPVMMSAQRHFSYHNAMLDFTVTHHEGEQGVLAEGAPGLQGPVPGSALGPPGAPAGRPAAATAEGRGAAASTGPEDVPGVPSAAWLKVTRGTPPADPFTPGDGFVVAIDGARFLPANVTISKVTVQAIAPDMKPLTKAYQALSQPDSDAHNPRYGTHFTLAQGVDHFDQAAATLLFTVYTRERWSGAFRVVGYTAQHVFIDARTQEQPLSKNVRDYVLNSGAFQLPLHVGLPSGGQPFRTNTLQQQVARVPCASLLVRIMTPELAKRQRRDALPDYADRVYDSMRGVPTPVERPLYSKYLSRKPLLVREAARLLASTKQGAPAAALPGTDPELLDWIEERLQPDDKSPVQHINYNMASEYYRDLGFYVSVDGAMRLPRNLPSGALISFAPPGSFYQDNPVVDDMKVTLEWDMASCMAAPRWIDGWQHFQDVVYEPGLVVLIDVRLLVPSAGSSMPAGWAVLPVFERTSAGQFVASGVYQLPLFQGVPSRHIIMELANKGDVDAVISQQLKVGRLKPHEECCSVVVRLVDASRQGQLEASPMQAGPGASGGGATYPDMAQQAARLRMPGYMNELGPRFLAAMRKHEANKTYAAAKPENVTDAAWRDMMASCLCKAAGLSISTALDDASEDEDEESVV